MSCVSSLAPCGTSCCVPVPQGVTNMLGFAGGHPCCKYDCIQFPPLRVQICLTINSQTQVTIQQGCATACPTAPSQPGCDLVFSAGATEDSWGRRCRQITWVRYVSSGTYIRIRLCAAQGCTDVCTTAGNGGAYTDACAAPNSLQQLSINGRDYSGVIQDTAASGGGVLEGSCLIQAACIGNIDAGGFDAATGSCCQWYVNDADATVVSWGLGVVNPGGATGGGIANLPIGTEIIVGPITLAGL
jgi:hypothetical protein